MVYGLWFMVYGLGFSVPKALREVLVQLLNLLFMFRVWVSQS